jgi:periplasmic protein CpxP/Spy
MKKSILIILLGIFSTSAIIAQDTAISKEERQQLKKMRKDMNLSAEQKAKLKAIHEERKATKEARKAASKEERKAINMKTNEAVKEILNDNQEAQRKEIQKKRREFKKN